MTPSYRNVTPQRLIRDLLECAVPKCSVCSRAATRTAVLRLLLPSSSHFCDKHSYVDVPHYENVQAKYEDVTQAQLIRAAEEWLKNNQVEELT